MFRFSVFGHHMRIISFSSFRFLFSSRSAGRRSLTRLRSSNFFFLYDVQNRRNFLLYRKFFYQSIFDQLTKKIYVRSTFPGFFKNLTLISLTISIFGVSGSTTEDAGKKSKVCNCSSTDASATPS